MDALRYRVEIRWLYQAALLLFLVTIGLGMARGIGLIDFGDRNQFLTHLHSGTIGWITLGILATVLWLYGGTGPRAEDRFVSWTSIILIVGVPIYVAAWWTGNLPFRAVGGALVLGGIVLFVWWLLRQAMRIGYRNLTTPQLGAVVGLVTLVVGSTLGVLLQIQFATGTAILPPENAAPAHAETQISAYLVLVAMSIAYWRLHGNDRTRGGTWMVWLFFIGGVFVAIALLANILPLSILYVPLDIAAFVLLLTVTWRKVVSPGWLARGSTRHYAIAIPFALVYIVIFVYLLMGFVVLKLWPDFSAIPPNLIPATEHPLFLGMVTNILFGLLYDLNRDRRIWPWADHVLFWGLNLAVAAFTVALLANAQDAFKLITPVLGVSLLVGIAAHTMRLWAAPTGDAVTAGGAASA
jgi:uncharacterized protein (DUF486 family)